MEDNKKTDINRVDKGLFAPGNKMGRPKGVQNKITKTVKETLGEFFDKNAQDMQNVYNRLSDRDKAQFIVAIAKILIPKDTPDVNVNTQISIPQIIIDVPHTEVK